MKRILFWTLLILYVSLFFVEKTNLTTSDLGRHITNGKIILQTKSVFSTNFYSYTYPNFEVSNHHWLWGVFAYILFTIGSFNLLSVINVVIGVLTFVLFLKSSLLQYDFVDKRLKYIAFCFVSIISIPIITSRKEVRPEMLSFLFCAIFYYVHTTKLNVKKSILLVILQIIWSNSHIFFVLGPAIIGCFSVDYLVSKNFKQFIRYAFFACILAASSLINPDPKAILTPFTIFSNYGYRIVENMGVFYLIKIIPNPIYYFYILIAVLVAIVISTSIILKNSIKVSSLVFVVVFMVAGFKVTRAFPLFGYFLIPVTTQALYFCVNKIKHHIHKIQTILITLVGVILPLIIFSALTTKILIPINQSFGFGLYNGVQGSAEFFKQNNIKGPIFNNYDIGGYLIFNLYPTEKVFVDNRPEAYPAKFFTNEYIPMQENNNLWNQKSQEYQFNTIFFYRKDLTPWAQKFLITRISDDTWVPVFVDDYTIIFVKNTDQNKNIISKYRIDRSIFKIT